MNFQIGFARLFGREIAAFVFLVQFALEIGLVARRRRQNGIDAAELVERFGGGVIERIEVGTFAASALEQIEMPGVTSIGSKAFAGCKFREIELPKSVKEVGFQVFSSCRNLEKVTLPEHLTALGSQFFTDCTALRTLVCRAATPPICIDDTFQLMPEGIRLYVPRKSLRQYADHEVWNRYFTEILPIGQ